MAELDQSLIQHGNDEIPENFETDGMLENFATDGMPETFGDDRKPENLEIVTTEENLGSQGLPENLQSEQRQEHQGDKVAGGGERWPGWPGESVFRILVPVQKVGGIIGRKGEYIKKMCEETKARIKILDGPPGTAERAVMVSAKEEPDASLPPAVNGLLRVHKRVIDGQENDGRAPPGGGGKVSTKLLVPSTQTGILIGKQGTTVKSIQESSNCIIKVLGTEDLPVFALQDDRIVEVVGEPAGVHKAIELIASHLRKFLVDRSIIPVFEMQMQMSNPQVEHMPPPSQSWGLPPQGFPPNASGGPGPVYGHSPHFMPHPRQHDNYFPPADMPPPRHRDNYYPPADMPPPRRHDNYYPPADMPSSRQLDNYYPPTDTRAPVDKQPHQGISTYGRETPLQAYASTNNQSPASLITQVTQRMQVPLSYADAVIGTDGANISYTRRVSGATVTIQESKGVPGEMTVEISGTASQVQTAQQLIQNYMAEAGAQSQNQTVTTANQGYNPYATQGALYASPHSNTGVPVQSGGYGPVYGANYGY